MSWLQRIGFGAGEEDERSDHAPADPGAELLELAQRRYAYARDAKREMLETWATALAFYVGDQLAEVG
jgi:hypothetical protein